VRYKIFRGAFSKWETLFAEAAEFANQIGAERLISISHSDDEVVAVWYWADDVEQHSPASR
jgi:hypothetical protein